MRIHTCMLVYVYMCTFVAHMCRYVCNVCKTCTVGSTSLLGRVFTITGVKHLRWSHMNCCRLQHGNLTHICRLHKYLFFFVKPALHKLLLTTVRNPRDWRKGQSEMSPFLCSCITFRRASISVIIGRSRMITMSACHQLWNSKPLGRSIVTKINSPQILVKNLVL